MPTRSKRPVHLALRIAALLIILPHPCPGAGDSWEKKPYTDWTASEAVKVLTDSPWSKIAIVQDLSGIGTTLIPIALSNRTQTGEKCPTCGSKGDEGAAVESAAFDAASGWGSAPAIQVIYFRVVFFSSARVRQALVRLAQLKGNTVPPQTLNQLQSPLADYVIALAGPFVEVFQNASLEDLKASTYLRSKKRAGTEFEFTGFVSPKESTDGMALFLFSRGGAGKHPFDAADGQAEFATGEGSSKIKASFKIDKMAVDGKLDF